MSEVRDGLGVKRYIDTPLGKLAYYSLSALEEVGLAKTEKMPLSIKILLENIARNYDGYVVMEDHVKLVGDWRPGLSRLDVEVPFMPSRVLLQDFTGVPVIVDLAAMRGAVARLGGDPTRINPLIPVHLIVDHSIQVDYFGSPLALKLNLEKEFERNRERYLLLKWAQKSFRNFYVVPPGRGIVHQVNLEYLAKTIDVREFKGEQTAFPDTLLGTDSHTPMVNGLGVLGWGVGGIEAEAVMLGQPYYMALPEVVGVRLVGKLKEGATATDLVLTITERLRKKGVTGKFVEYFGPALKELSVPDRATIANMAPEYGATVGFFPIDEMTLSYLRLTGRDERHVKTVELYAKLQGLFVEDYEREAHYSDVVEIDLSEVESTIAGPANPEDRIPLKRAKERFEELLQSYIESKRGGGSSDSHYEGFGISQATQPTVQSVKRVEVKLNGEVVEVKDGSVVIAAITSCTNTSNPFVMLGAGILAKKAVEKGLKRPPHVKTSLAPGSAVVKEYLDSAGLTPSLEALGFHVVGYGCTTCIGNSGPLPAPIAKALEETDIYTVAVLSGNRNFEGRIHPQVRASFLMSPILVVAYALAGRMDIDLFNEPIAIGSDGKPIYLRDIWPTSAEIRETVERVVKSQFFVERYKDVFKGDEMWESLLAPESPVYEWDPSSTYIREPPFFDDLKLEVEEPKDIVGARVLALLGDRVTTDHISPAGAIPPHSPAGKYLLSLGVRPEEFNTYGARRGNHEVMMRGTLANIRLKNELVPGTEGWWTIHVPSGEKMTVYDAAMRYKSEKTPLLILAGKQYGAGSSRDWAAKGVYLLGVKAVIAESFERIHRSNLVGMGILPLQFKEGEGWRQLGLNGKEEYSIVGISEGLSPRKELTVIAKRGDERIEFKVTARLDTQIEVEYYRHGGILQYVLRKIVSGSL